MPKRGDGELGYRVCMLPLPLFCDRGGGLLLGGFSFFTFLLFALGRTGIKHCHLGLTDLINDYI